MKVQRIAQTDLTNEGPLARSESNERNEAIFSSK